MPDILCATEATMQFVWCVVLLQALGSCRGLLYPRESESRDVRLLDGLWNFRADYSADRNAGFQEEWFKYPLSQTGEVIYMPVPSSFNEITQNVSLREFVGWVWYDRQVWVPGSWGGDSNCIMIRFESAHYNSIAWVNGVEVVSHSGGHLPFEANVTDLVKTGAPNRITVAINNTLTPHTLPPGTLSFGHPPNYPPGYFVQNIQFDFYNYAGLHRPVKLYTTPLSVHVDNVSLVTSLLANGSALLSYQVEVFTSGSGGVELQLSLKEKEGGSVVGASLQLSGCQKVPSGCVVTGKGQLVVDKPRLWWPWTMNPGDPGYLYQLEMIAKTPEGVSDYYRLPVGLRTVLVNGTQFLINGKPFYFLGFGKHEDADVRGKGLDYPLLMKDINLIKWLGGNSFRTSHYPYSEELMDLCDQHGIVVIDESPAVGLHYEENFANETLQHHLEVMWEMVQRDRNRPAVVMWSLANEPHSSFQVAVPYFKTVANFTRTLDPTRPIMFADNMPYDQDLCTQFMDVITINRYYSWYNDPGHTETIATQLATDLQDWFKSRGKPMMLSEYGAGTVAGLHRDPPTMFTEDYQMEVLLNTWPVFDQFRDSFIIGELIWNFADFQTDEATSRVDGNKKGILTRWRQPKPAARLLRQRYLSLGLGIKTCFDPGLMGFSGHPFCTP